ncbi:hypothetical protein EDD21DRAFT_393241 [Dissophora ornata]|nr:hypothetical protein EDD21DRAFT_393241 [Dissophora ornata]
MTRQSILVLFTIAALSIMPSMCNGQHVYHRHQRRSLYTFHNNIHNNDMSNDNLERFPTFVIREEKRKRDLTNDLVVNVVSSATTQGKAFAYDDDIYIYS